MQLLDVSQRLYSPFLLFPDFGPRGTVQRAEQPLRPRRGLPPAKENRRICCQVSERRDIFGTLAFHMGHCAATNRTSEVSLTVLS